MKKDKMDLFVPGRLCLLGEHSDWASNYRRVNEKIEKGYAIVTGIEQGIYASVTYSKKLIVEDLELNKNFESNMDYDSLIKIAKEGSYWSYVAGTAAVILKEYNVSGIKITITKTTIPVKKGLSSSAAICVLVARAFNNLYNLHLSTLDEMNLAYLGEIETPSRCGRLDQACAFGTRPVLITFDGDKIDVEDITVGDNFYFVFADLMAGKDTVKILNDLNKGYPFPTNNIEKNVEKCLGKINKENIFKAIELIKSGKVKEYGKLMIKAQNDFDNYVAPACLEELTSPVLHKVFDDKKVKELCYGYKGVGSQGDGTIQFLAKDEKSQKELIDYLEKVLKMDSYSLTLEKTNCIKKAIIPLAGNGTRMYPITKVLKKAFLPIIDSDNIVKPAIMCLLEELYDAGIEEIGLVIDRDDVSTYDLFFKSELTPEVTQKLSKELLEYENKIRKIGKILTYIFQDEKLGFGHAIYMCKDFANNEDVLLVLGDQIYKSSNNKSCTFQLLEQYKKNNSLTISVSEIPLNNVFRYGILSGSVQSNNNYYKVDKMYEKPDIDYAKNNLYTTINNKKKYYSVFGEYIIKSEIFNMLEDNIKNKRTEKGEYELTSVLDKYRERKGMIAFIPDGITLDIGNVNSYKNTLIEMMEEK